ncbi:hypothetical protein COOONC_24620 [Cooperia oncophora]
MRMSCPHDHDLDAVLLAIIDLVGVAQLPKALTGEEESMDTQHHVENTARMFGCGGAVAPKADEKAPESSKSAIQRKETNVRHESKYSGRKRKQKF